MRVIVSTTPEQDAVIALTAETADMQDEINLVWQYLLPAIKQDKLPENKSAAALKQKLNALSLPLPAKSNSAVAKTINAKAFELENNEKHLQAISFNFSNNICQVVLKKDDAIYKIDFGSGAWQKSVTTKPGPSLLAAAKENFAILAKSKIAGSYQWKGAGTLELALRYIESPHTETYVCHFDKKDLSLTILNSFDFGNKKTELKGTMK
jgi:hypothetical protein